MHQPPMTVITGVERRRVWTEDMKREILEDAFAPGACVEHVAKRRDIPKSLIGASCSRHEGDVGPMISVPRESRVWLALGHTDMRRGMNSLGLHVQEILKRNPNGGDFFVFRGRNGGMIKILWHDGLGISLYVKKLERGRFIWPSPVDGTVSITSAQLGYLLEGIDWRNPVYSFRPEYVG